MIQLSACYVSGWTCMTCLSTHPTVRFPLHHMPKVRTGLKDKQLYANLCLDLFSVKTVVHFLLLKKQQHCFTQKFNIGYL